MTTEMSQYDPCRIEFSQLSALLFRHATPKYFRYFFKLYSSRDLYLNQINMSLSHKTFTSVSIVKEYLSQTASFSIHFNITAATNELYMAIICRKCIRISLDL